MPKPELDAISGVGSLPNTTAAKSRSGVNVSRSIISLHSGKSYVSKPPTSNLGPNTKLKHLALANDLDSAQYFEQQYKNKQK